MSWLETDNDHLMRESARQKKLDFVRRYPAINGEIRHNHSNRVVNDIRILARF